MSFDSRLLLDLNSLNVGVHGQNVDYQANITVYVWHYVLEFVFDFLSELHGGYWLCYWGLRVFCESSKSCIGNPVLNMEISLAEVKFCSPGINIHFELIMRWIGWRWNDHLRIGLDRTLPRSYLRCYSLCHLRKEPKFNLRCLFPIFVGWLP